MHNIEKGLNILLKSCDIHSERILKYVWSFFNIIINCKVIKKVFDLIGLKLLGILNRRLENAESYEIFRKSL